MVVVYGHTGHVTWWISFPLRLLQKQKLGLSFWILSSLWKSIVEWVLEMLPLQWSLQLLIILSDLTSISWSLHPSVLFQEYLCIAFSLKSLLWASWSLLSRCLNYLLVVPVELLLFVKIESRTSFVSYAPCILQVCSRHISGLPSVQRSHCEHIDPSCQGLF